MPSLLYYVDANDGEYSVRVHDNGDESVRVVIFEHGDYLEMHSAVSFSDALEIVNQLLRSYYAGEFEVGGDYGESTVVRSFCCAPAYEAPSALIGSQAF